jgi:hypothetical protein
MKRSAPAAINAQDSKERSMTRDRLGVVLALGIVAALGGCATSSQHVEPYRDVSCFQRAQISLAQAIATAEQEEGQMAIDAEYNCAAELDCVRGNPGQYRIAFLSDGRLKYVGVCPATGRIQNPVEKGALRRILDLDFVFDWPESEMRKSGPIAQKAPVRIGEAVAIAEGSGGKAMAAHVKSAGSSASYVIELVDQGKLRVVSVDLLEGTIIR